MEINSTKKPSSGIDPFSETLATLKENFRMEATGHIDFGLNDFEVFKDYTEFDIKSSYRIKNADDDCYLLFAETYKNTPGPKGSVTGQHEYQTWALAYLKCDMGRVMIRRETLKDKLKELVHPIELDFKDDKPFSDTFYVLVDDVQKALAGIDRNFRNAVMDIREDDFVIEVKGHTLLIGNRKPISPQRAVHLAEFVERLVEICG